MTEPASSLATTAVRRRAELAGSLAAVRDRIAAACMASGRGKDEVTLIAVTKTYPASDVLHLLTLGVTEIGENRDQEAAPKAAEVAALIADANWSSGKAAGGAVCEVGKQADENAAGAQLAPRWHFVGRLQRNKCRSVVTYADVIHSVDNVELVRTLDRQAAQRRDRPLEVLVQVSLDGDTGRGGAHGDAVLSVAAEIAQAEALRLGGVMSVAPLGWVPEKAYTELGRYITLVQADHPDATVVSAGMSDDLEVAVACGATHVRIGSALLGMRPPLG